jgi:hypothetical protein
LGTLEFVGGLTPLKTANGTHVLSHVGVRLDGGFQLGPTALTAGIRGWEVRDTAYDASGFDVFLSLSRRILESNRTAVRGTVAAGTNRQATQDLVGNATAYHEGFSWSVGLEHELPVWSERAVISTDLLFPGADDNPFHRGRPVLELGVGLRARFFQMIGPISRSASR